MKMATLSSERELVETALHVLVDWNDGRRPAPAEVDLLKQAFPSSAHLEIDGLCCQIVHDLCGRPLREQERKAHPTIIDDVA